MSATDNSLVGQPSTKRPGGKPEQAGDAKPAPRSTADQPFAPEAAKGGRKPRNPPGEPAPNDASPQGDKAQFGNGAGSNAS